MSDWLVRAAVVCAYLLAFLLMFEAQAILVERASGWRLGVTLSAMGERWPAFAIGLTAFIWFACGLFTFHLIDYSGITR